MRITSTFLVTRNHSPSPLHTTTTRTRASGHSGGRGVGLGDVCRAVCDTHTHACKEALGGWLRRVHRLRSSYHFKEAKIILAFLQNLKVQWLSHTISVLESTIDNIIQCRTSLPIDRAIIERYTQRYPLPFGFSKSRPLRFLDTRGY